MWKARWILTIIFLALGTMAAMLPEASNPSSVRQPEAMLEHMQVQASFLNVDELAALLIQQDPAIQLIDVRPAEAYQAYSLPGAINIPMDSLLSPTLGGYLDQDLKKNVLFSNGSTTSIQAWMLLNQLGYPNNYVLEGGMNAWFDHIIKPQRPPETASEAAFSLYEQRVAASMYFTGKTGTPPPPPKKTLKPIKRKKKGMVQGGCS